MESEGDTLRVAEQEFFAECARVGFGIRELGAVAIVGGAGQAAFADALAVLRSLPSGAGFAAFCARIPNGPALMAAHEARMAAKAREARRCSFCRRPGTSERPLAQGPGRVAICRDCAQLVLDALE